MGAEPVMTRVLMLSSFVAHGHVGLSAGATALQMLGHEVTQLPTVILSNHPGWPHVSGASLPVAQLRGMVQALAANGWLSGTDAVQTGYLPSADHVHLAVELVEHLRAANPAIRVVVDPVLGDRPKGLYVPDAVAVALRDNLAPRADLLTPNAFELGWLTGRATETLDDALFAARQLAGGTRLVLLTSAPLGTGRTGLLHSGQDVTGLWSAALREGVPNGVGDVLAALVTAGLAPGAALGHLDVLIRESLGAPHLRIAEAAPTWTLAPPLAPDPQPDLQET